MRLLAAILTVLLLGLFQAEVAVASPCAGDSHAHAHVQTPSTKQNAASGSALLAADLSGSGASSATGREHTVSGPAQLHDGSHKCPVHGSDGTSDCCVGACFAGATLQRVSMLVSPVKSLPGAPEVLRQMPGLLPRMLERPPRN